MNWKGYPYEENLFRGNKKPMMDDYNLLSNMDAVKAPPGFEQGVMAEIALKKKKRLKVKRLNLSLAGACASLAIVALLAHFFIIPQRFSREATGLRSEGASLLDQRFYPQKNSIIPITEAVDYTGEIQKLTREPRTIYILEQVSHSTDTSITY